MRARRRIRLADERGFTLVELLVASAMTLIVLGAVFTLLRSTESVAAKDQERPSAIAEAQVGLARMTREMRQAIDVYSVDGLPVEVFPAAGTSIEFAKEIDGTPTRIRYDCGAGACLRSTSTNLAAPVAASAATERLVPHVTSASFDVPQPWLVEIGLRIPESGGAANGFTSTSVLEESVLMRNVGTE